MKFEMAFTHQLSGLVSSCPYILHKNVLFMRLSPIFSFLAALWIFLVISFFPLLVWKLYTEVYILEIITCS